MNIIRETSEELKIFSNYLKDKGLRMTHQRETVVEAFLKAGGHVSADELYELVREADSKIGSTTVFRTLKALTDCGLAREVDLSDGRIRFERLYKRPHHHHMVCVECNRTIEFLSPELEQIQTKIVSEYQFKPVQHRVQIYGVCQDCQNQREPGSEAVDADLVFVRDALKIAMETEKRGVNFYKTASEIVTHESTRSTFLKMMEDEKSHLSGLEKEWDQLIREHEEVLDAPVFLHFDFASLKRIFPNRDQVKEKLKLNLSAKDALKIAMEMERDAYRFFREYAQKFNETKGKDVFSQFAEEELEHYELIQKEYEQISEELES